MNFSGNSFPSLLERDDLAGPGKGKFPRSAKGFSVDYAIYKVAMYSGLESVQEKTKFIKDLDVLMLQLGKKDFEVVASDYIAVRKEFALIIVDLMKIAKSMGKDQVKSLIPILDIFLNSEAEILEIISEKIRAIAGEVDQEDLNKWLVTALLGITHEESPNKREIGIVMLSKVVDLFEIEVCEVFVLPDILALAQGDDQSKLMAIQVIPNLAKALRTRNSVERLIDLFTTFCAHPSLDIRLACVPKFELFSFCEDSLQIQKLQPCFKELLKDKSEKIAKKALFQLGPFISNTKAPFPHPLLDMYLKLARNASNDKELQVHCAFYFPAILEKMGKASWNILNESYFYLAFNGDINCKKSITASLQHIARLLQEKATTELFPVVISYLNDKTLRISILKNLPEIIANFEEDSRVLVLDSLKNFAKEKNFRIRIELAKKIGKISVLIKPQICFKTIWPILKNLCLDGIGTVRHSAIQEIGRCAVHIMNNSPELSNEIIRDLKKFFSSANSTHRLVFAGACENLIELVEFEVAFGDDFKKLCSDKVSTVRILCARAVKKACKSSARNYWKELCELIKIDEDSDVRNEVLDQQVQFIDFVQAEESQNKIGPSLTRNREKDQEFEECWEFESSDCEFQFLNFAIRPKFKGFCENIAFKQKTLNMINLLV